MKHKIRLARIEARLPQRAVSSPWDLSLLPDETLEALQGFMEGNPTDEELEKLIAGLPEEMLKQIERAYGGPDE